MTCPCAQGCSMIVKSGRSLMRSIRSFLRSLKRTNDVVHVAMCCGFVVPRSFRSSSFLQGCGLLRRAFSGGLLAFQQRQQDFPPVLDRAEHAVDLQSVAILIDTVVDVCCFTPLDSPAPTGRGAIPSAGAARGLWRRAQGNRHCQCKQ